VKLYLFRLFELSGLFSNVDIQGAWTLTLLPKTKGGRWFTLNIGSHEVAFSTKSATEGNVQHFIVLDRLILEYPDTIVWIGNRDGSVDVAEYVAAERAVVVNFNESFANAERFFTLPGVRRALIATTRCQARTDGPEQRHYRLLRRTSDRRCRPRLRPRPSRRPPSRSPNLRNPRRTHRPYSDRRCLARRLPPYHSSRADGPDRRRRN
jgi:hypothetical protein